VLQAHHLSIKKYLAVTQNGNHKSVVSPRAAHKRRMTGDGKINAGSVEGTSRTHPGKQREATSMARCAEKSRGKYGDPG